MDKKTEPSKQKVVYILPSTVVSSAGSRMFVFSQYREPIANMQVHFGENYQVTSAFIDKIKVFEEDTIYLIPEQLRHVVNSQKIPKKLMVPSNIFAEKVLEDIRREVLVLQLRRPI